MHKKVIEVKITNPWAPDFTHLHKGSEYKPFDFNSDSCVGRSPGVKQDGVFN